MATTLVQAGVYHRFLGGQAQEIAVRSSERSHRPVMAQATAVIDSASGSTQQDPALTMGTLPNGMRYYIRVSNVPAKRARLWLAVNAGAIQEDEDQRGFAHFLEHMAFNGTRHFPKNTMIDFIEQSGMQFGGDLNAYTSFDETVYQLTVPTDNPAVLTKGLQIVEDWASGGITIDSTDVVQERGVVLGEWRTRNPDTLSQRLADLQFGLLFGDSSRYLKRFPIGLPSLLRTAQPDPIRRFYRDWYRPDLMAIIAVGDFDKAAIEREIRKRFGKIPAVTNPRPFVRPNGPSRTTPVVQVVRDHLNPVVQVIWNTPPLPTTQMGVFRQQMIEGLLFQHTQRTLTKMSRKERRPFAGASVSRSRGFIRPLGEMYVLELIVSPDSLERGLFSVLTELQRIAQHGIPATILDPLKAAMLRQAEHAVAATAIPSRQLAESYVQHYLGDGGILLSPQQELSLIRQMLPEVTSAVMAKAAQFWQTSGSPTITVTIPKFASVRTPTREIMLALLDSAARTAVPEDILSSVPENGIKMVANATTMPLVAQPVLPGKVEKEQYFAKSRVTVWTLPNGIRVLFKPSMLQSDEVVLKASSLGGFSRLADSLFYTPARYVGALMTAAGGFGDLNREQLERALNSTAIKDFRVAINAFDEEVLLEGSPKELETLFQMMYLQFTAPKLDTADLAEWRRYGGWMLEMSPNDALAAVLARGDARLTPLSYNLVNLVALIDPKQAMTVYQDRFGDPGDFTFIIAGAASPAQVKPLVERYLGSLPTANRGEREQAKDLKIRPIQTKQDIPITDSRVPPEKAQNILVFDGPLSTVPAENLRERRLLSTVSWILSNRLRNRLREEMAVTYGVSAPVRFYRNPQSHYRFEIQVLTAPDKIKESVRNIWQIIDTLKTIGVTTREIAGAATVARRSMENAMESNRWWIMQLQDYDQLGLSLDAIGDVNSFAPTPAEVQAAVQRYLPKDRYLQQTLMPPKSKIEEYEKEQRKDSIAKDSILKRGGLAIQSAVEHMVSGNRALAPCTDVTRSDWMGAVFGRAFCPPDHMWSIPQ